jgi:serine/threonine-protein kinase HipA
MSDTAKLFVYRADCFVGTLEMPDFDDCTFTYCGDYLASGQPPLAKALPLQAKSIKAPAVLMFFDGLLPEGSERDLFARFLHKSTWNTHGLLAALGGECIGDIVLLTEEMQNAGYQNIDSGYTALDTETLEALLKPTSSERIAAEIKNRISLAGAQSKISLYRASDDDLQSSDGWSLPYGLAASTHILKPQSRQFEGLVENEIFCMQLAQACGIDVAKTAVLRLDEPVLVVKRFDRLRDEAGTVIRLPQEDICQILSISPLHKYESDGGPGFEKVLDVLMRWSAAPLEDIQDLIKRALFNYLIGNCDAHGKNYSLSTALDGTTRLAPAYDLVSTTFYPGISHDMAMKVGERYSREQITNADFLTFAKQLGIDDKAVHDGFTALASLITAHAEPVADVLVAAGLTEVEAIAKHILKEVQQHAALLS